MPFSASSAADRADQLLQLGNEAGIERHGQGPARCIELRGQFMTAAYRLVREIADHLPDGDLMRRVAHREITGDGKGRDLGRVGQDGLADGLDVERRLFVARRLVTATVTNTTGSVPRACFEAGTLQRFHIIAQQNEADRRAVAFDDGVGGERRRHGDQRDIGRFHTVGQVAAVPPRWRL